MLNMPAPSGDRKTEGQKLTVRFDSSYIRLSFGHVNEIAGSWREFPRPNEDHTAGLAEILPLMADDKTKPPLNHLGRCGRGRHDNDVKRVRPLISGLRQLLSGYVTRDFFLPRGTISWKIFCVPDVSVSPEQKSPSNFPKTAERKENLPFVSSKDSNFGVNVRMPSLIINYLPGGLQFRVQAARERSEIENENKETSTAREFLWNNVNQTKGNKKKI